MSEHPHEALVQGLAALGPGERGVAGLRHPALQGIDHEITSRGELPVDGCQRDVGASGHLTELDGLVPSGPEQFEHRVDDVVP